MSTKIIRSSTAKIWSDTSIIEGKVSAKSILSSKTDLEAPTSYSELPADILLLIFQYFNEKELRKNIIPVCQRWKYIALRSNLWKKLTVRGKHTPTNFTCLQIRLFPNLEKVCLIEVLEPVTILRQICRYLFQLKHFILRQSDCVIGESSLRNLVKCCKKLQTLDLKGTSVKGVLFYQELSQLQNLKNINMSGNPYLTNNNLMTVVLNCRGLEELYLSKFSPGLYQNQLNDADMSFMVTNVSNTLRCLVIEAITLTDIAFESILRCSKLEHLGLYGAANLSSRIFLNLWKYLPKLKKLQIRHAHQITDADVQELFTVGKSVMQQLEVVDFTGCWKIKSKGIQAIAKCCTNLKTLSLKSCKSIDDLSVLRESCSKLELLNIAFCYVECKTLLPLPSNIKTLIVNEGGEFNELIEKIEEQHPYIAIHACLSEYNNTIRKL